MTTTHGDALASAIKLATAEGISFADLPASTRNDLVNRVSTATTTTTLAAYAAWRLARAQADIDYLTAVQDTAGLHSGGYITHKQQTGRIHAAWLQKIADEQAADATYLEGGGLK